MMMLLKKFLNDGPATSKKIWKEKLSLFLCFRKKKMADQSFVKQQTFRDKNFMKRHVFFNTLRHQLVAFND